MVRIIFKSGRILDLENVDTVFIESKSPLNTNDVKIKHMDDASLDEYCGEGDKYLEGLKDETLA